MITSKEYLVLSELVYVTDCEKVADFDKKSLAELDASQFCSNNLMPGGPASNWKTLVNEMTDWKMVNYGNDNENSGFRSITYEKTSMVNGVPTTEIAFAFAGTEPLDFTGDALLPEDILDDVTLMSGRDWQDYLSPTGIIKFGVDVTKILSSMVADAVIGLVPDSTVKEQLLQGYNQIFNATGQSEMPDQFGLAVEYTYNTLLERSIEKGDNVPTSSANGVPTLSELAKFYNVSFTGHSLGGAVAQYMAFQTDSVKARAVTFDAPGIYNLLPDPKVPSAYNVLDITDENDIVGTVSVGLGQTLKVKTALGQTYVEGGNYTSDSALVTAASAVILKTHMLQNLIDNIDATGNFQYMPSTHAYIYDSNGYIIKNPDLATQINTAQVLNGGSGDDILQGFAGNDKLYGNAANDLLSGGAGADYLAGGAGNDTYVFGRGYGQDTIYDYEKATGNVDVLKLAQDISATDLILSQSGSNLVISVKGTADSITIKDQFKATSETTGFLWWKKTTTNYYNKVEKIELSNGATLVETQVQQLIQAMSSFSQQTGLSWSQALEKKPQEVEAIISQFWKPQS